MSNNKQFEMVLKHSVLIAEDGARESWFGNSQFNTTLDVSKCVAVKDVAVAALKWIKGYLCQSGHLHAVRFVSESVEHGEGYAYVKVRYHEANRDSGSMLSGYVVCPRSLPDMQSNDIISVLG